MAFEYLYYRTTRDLTNLSMVKRRGYDGYIVSMNQSGTHWLIHMLGLALAERYGLPVSDRLNVNTLVGMPRVATDLSEIPRITHSHQIPNPILRYRWVLDLLRMPDYVLLLRDPRVVMASHYKRFAHEYRISFSDYLRARRDVLLKAGGRTKFDKSLWWNLRFQNGWHALRRARPDSVLVCRYEALRSDTLGELRRIVDFIGLQGVDDALLVRAIERSTKQDMARKEDPSRTNRIVHADSDYPLALYSDADKAYFLKMFRRHCKADFGYDLEAGW